MASTSLRIARMFSRAITREPIAAWIGTSNGWRGISLRSLLVIDVPYAYALSLWTIAENASTVSPCSRMSTLTRLASCSPAIS